MTTWIEGIDAAWSRPTPSQLIAAGKRFIVGYVSHDVSKNLTRAECLAYLDAGIGVGLVWETTTDRALSGGSGGLEDGKEARRQANAIGFPTGKPIFTAVDFDATSAQLDKPIRGYLNGFASTVGGIRLAGVYGGLDTVKFALTAGLVGLGWQTYAWSTIDHKVVWDPRAYAQQYRNGVKIDGHDTDLDRVKDLSAFWTKETPVAGNELTTDNILTEVWNGAVVPPIPGMPAGTKKDSAATALQDTRNTAHRIETSMAELVADLKTSGGQVTIDVETLRQLIAAELDKALNATKLTHTVILDK